MMSMAKPGRINGLAPDTGVFLPMGCNFTRNTAERHPAVSGVMDSAGVPGNMDNVVFALPLGALIASLFRYPSPQGWPRSIFCGPSFFCFRSNGYKDRQGHAGFVSGVRPCFDGGRGLAFCVCKTQRHQTRGERSCADTSFGYSFLQGLAPVATRHLNKRSSAQARAWARRPFWTATLRRAPLWGPRATCCIARPTRGAVSQRGEGIWCSPHWQCPENSVEIAPWGVSNKRGTYDGHYTSSNPVGSFRRMQRPGSIESDEFRPVPADSDYGINVSTGAMRTGRTHDRRRQSAGTASGRRLRFVRFQMTRKGT